MTQTELDNRVDEHNSTVTSTNRDCKRSATKTNIVV